MTFIEPLNTVYNTNWGNQYTIHIRGKFVSKSIASQIIIACDDWVLNPDNDDRYSNVYYENVFNEIGDVNINNFENRTVSLNKIASLRLVNITQTVLQNKKILWCGPSGDISLIGRLIFVTDKGRSLLDDCEKLAKRFKQLDINVMLKSVDRNFDDAIFTIKKGKVEYRHGNLCTEIRSIMFGAMQIQNEKAIECEKLAKMISITKKDVMSRICGVIRKHTKRLGEHFVEAWCSSNLMSYLIVTKGDCYESMFSPNHIPTRIQMDIEDLLNLSSVQFSEPGEVSCGAIYDLSNTTDLEHIKLQELGADPIKLI